MIILNYHFHIYTLGKIKLSHLFHLHSEDLIKYLECLFFQYLNVISFVDRQNHLKNKIY